MITDKEGTEGGEKQGRRRGGRCGKGGERNNRGQQAMV